MKRFIKSLLKKTVKVLKITIITLISVWLLLDTINIVYMLSADEDTYEFHVGWKHPNEEPKWYHASMTYDLLFIYYDNDDKYAVVKVCNRLNDNN